MALPPCPKHNQPLPCPECAVDPEHIAELDKDREKSLAHLIREANGYIARIPVIKLASRLYPQNQYWKQEPDKPRQFVGMKALQAFLRERGYAFTKDDDTGKLSAFPPIELYKERGEFERRYDLDKIKSEPQEDDEDEAKPRRSRKSKPVAASEGLPRPRIEELNWYTLSAFPLYAISDAGMVMRLADSDRSKAGTIIKARCYRGQMFVALYRDGERYDRNVGLLLLDAKSNGRTGPKIIPGRKPKTWA
jgi:hypothetical protein